MSAKESTSRLKNLMFKSVLPCRQNSNAITDRIVHKPKKRMLTLLHVFKKVFYLMCHTESGRFYGDYGTFYRMSSPRALYAVTQRAPRAVTIDVIVTRGSRPDPVYR